MRSWIRGAVRASILLVVFTCVFCSLGSAACVGDGCGRSGSVRVLLSSGNAQASAHEHDVAPGPAWLSAQPNECASKTYPKTGTLVPVKLPGHLIVDVRWGSWPAEKEQRAFALTMSGSTYLEGPLWTSSDPGRPESWSDASETLRAAVPEAERASLPASPGVVAVHSLWNGSRTLVLQGRDGWHWASEDAGATWRGLRSPGQDDGASDLLVLHPNDPARLLAVAPRVRCPASSPGLCARDLHVSADLGRTWRNATATSGGILTSVRSALWGAGLRGLEHLGVGGPEGDDAIIVAAWVNPAPAPLQARAGGAADGAGGASAEVDELVSAASQAEQGDDQGSSASASASAPPPFCPFRSCYPGWEKDSHVLASPDGFASLPTAPVSQGGRARKGRGSAPGATPLALALPCGAALEAVAGRLHAAVPSECPVDAQGRPRATPGAAIADRSVTLLVAGEATGGFAEVCLPSDLEDDAYNFVPTHDGRGAYVLADHAVPGSPSSRFDGPVADLYAPGPQGRFGTLSLRRVHRRGDAVDLSRLEGLPGALAANVADPPTSALAEWGIRSLRSLDGGASWSPLRAPDAFLHDVCASCSVGDVSVAAASPVDDPEADDDEADDEDSEASVTAASVAASPASSPASPSDDRAPAPGVATVPGRGKRSHDGRGRSRRSGSADPSLATSSASASASASSCSLHLHGPTAWLSPLSPRPSLYSRPSAPGLVLGTGNAGSRLDAARGACTWASSDGGATWRDVAPEPLVYELGASGSALLAARHAAAGPTDTLLLSFNHGSCWHRVTLPEPVLVSNIVADDEGAGAAFLVHGSACTRTPLAPQCTHVGGGAPSGVAFALDVRELLAGDLRGCGTGDLEGAASREDWSPPEGCALGASRAFSRKRPDVECLEPKGYAAPAPVETFCNCSAAADLECEYGLEPRAAGLGDSPAGTLFDTRALSSSSSNGGNATARVCAPIQGLSPGACPAWKAGVGAPGYAASSTGLRLIHGDVCEDLERLIPDTDGRGGAASGGGGGGGGGGSGGSGGSGVSFLGRTARVLLLLAVLGAAGLAVERVARSEGELADAARARLAAVGTAAVAAAWAGADAVADAVQALKARLGGRPRVWAGGQEGSYFEPLSDRLDIDPEDRSSAALFGTQEA